MLNEKYKKNKRSGLARCFICLFICLSMFFTMLDVAAFAYSDNDNETHQSSVSENDVWEGKKETVEFVNMQTQEEMMEQLTKGGQETTETGAEESTKESQMRVYATEGAKSYNINAQHYKTWSWPVYSYVFENEDGGVTRAEYIGSEFIVEKYDKLYNLENKTTLTFVENAVFGGFYHGEKNNFIMLGHKDADKEKGIPQYELQIYDSVFTLVDTIFVDGTNSNTKELPFGATSVQFEELDDFLYVRTGHILGETDEQAGHQETLYFMFDTSEKVLLYVDDTYKGNAYGDLGHTLNRYLRINEGRLYAVEQQDFNPGGVFLFELPLYQIIKEKLGYTIVADFPVEPGTYGIVSITGTIGGMEFSDNNSLVVGSYKNRGSSEWERNIFVSVTPVNENTGTTKMIYLTDYEIGSRIVATTPQLIKVSNNRFAVLWTNYFIPDKEEPIYYSDCETETCYLFIDGDGNILTDVIKIDASLSDCQPIVHNGNIVWYYTNYSSPMFIQIPVDGSVPVWNPTAADYYEVVVNYPEDSNTLSYSYGSEVILNPKNISGKSFDHWELVSGDVIISETGEKSLNFRMPADKVIISAIYEDEIVDVETSDTDEENKKKYNVSFYNQKGESGDGDYEPGEIVTIRADEMTEGRRFREWSSIYGDWDGFQSKSSPVTTFVMPESDVYIQTLYDYGNNVTVEDGSGDGTYFEGDEVTIKADEIEGKTFSHWYCPDINGRSTFVYLKDMYASVTTFEMPDNDVIIKAVYKTTTNLNGDEYNGNVDDSTNGATSVNTGNNMNGNSNGVGNFQTNARQDDDLTAIGGVKVTDISITAPSKKLAAGKKVKLSAQVTPSNATNSAVTWQTSNTKYATIDQNGKLTLKKAGAGKTVTVTATAVDGSGVKATYKIKIMKHAVKSIKLSATSKSVTAGKSIKLKATIKTTGKKANKTLKWTSSNTKYATVTKSGKVKTKKAGKGKNVKITAQATDGTGKKASIKMKLK